MEQEPRRIPVGYLTKTAADVRKGDAVRNFGKVLSVKNVGEHIFTDEKFKIDYKDKAVELKTKSPLTGRYLYEVLAFDAPVEIIMYEIIY